MSPANGLSDPSLSAELNRILKGSQSTASVQVLDLESGKSIYSHAQHSPLKPASVLKLLTSAAALETLGPHFQFETKFYVDSLIQGRAKTLFVRGGGDPRLTSEVLWLAIRELKLRGLRSIDKLVLDDGLFLEEHGRQGQRAYQTGASALALNFNSFKFLVCPGRNGASVSTDPFEYKVQVTNQVKSSGSGGAVVNIDETNSARGAYRVDGKIGGSDFECLERYRSVADPLDYLSQTFGGLASGLDISGPKLIESGRAPDTAQLIWVQASERLSRIVEDMNHFSTNFISEQILYAIGRESESVWSRRRGLGVLAEYLKKLKISDSEYSLADGSGLSHANRISADALAQVLRHMHNESPLGPEFEKSLAISGQIGTLKRREFRIPVALRGKTGTIDGVVSLAGYLETRRKGKLAFVIIQNNVRSKDRAVAIEDSIIKILHGKG